MEFFLEEMSYIQQWFCQGQILLRGKYLSLTSLKLFHFTYEIGFCAQVCTC